MPVLEAPAEPTEADLPLLVKASAGGGGRGMRVVRRLADLAGEVAAAEAEALSAFGDGTVFVEPYVERGRHVEVQVFGTTAIGERDCSLQRRHQKVVEEAPAPHLSADTRDAMFAAAEKAAGAIDYQGAGTVEFLVDAEDPSRFWFLEMNTRLQVEHPVTELVWGVDLVAMQLGEAAAPGQPAGHAIEVRLYAEDPVADYQPQSGVLSLFEIPAGEGIRVDAGYESGSTVSTFYDAMLAKVVCHAPTREAAARKLADTLARARIHGVVTNRDLLVAGAAVGGVRERRGVSTAFLGDGGFVTGASAPSSTSEHAVAAAIALAERAGAARTVQQGIPVGWRNVPSQPHRTEFDDGTVVEWWRGRDGYVLDGDHSVVEVRLASPNHSSVTLETDGVRTTYDVTINGDDVDVDGPTGHTRLTRKPRFTDPADAVASGSLLAPMPGTVVRVAVEPGAEVVGRPGRAGARGDEDAAHRGGAVRRRGHPGRRTRGTTGGGGRRARCRGGERMTSFSESEERQELRRQVARLASKYGREYFTEQARSGGKTTDLWLEMGKNGYLGINIPEAYGGGGGGIGDIAAVCEELAAQGCPLLMMVVSPAICGTVIARYGTEEQKQRWLPGIADGTGTMAFAITEPDAGTNSHNITTTARRDGDEWVLNGRKIYISGVDEADNVLVVARAEDAKTGKLKPCLFVVPTDAAGFEARPIPMEIVSPEQQFQVFIDDVRLPGDALVGDEDAGLVQLFAGLNPERIMAASFSTGLARFALGKAAAYAKERTVFQGPIGGHQAIAHPLAMSHIEIEMARLMTQKAAALYDAGDDMGAGEAANMAKYAAAEAACDAADRAVQTHGGNGITQEYGMAGLLVATRAGRIAPVSREMILNFVAMHSLGLPKSY